MDPPLPFENSDGGYCTTIMMARNYSKDNRRECFLYCLSTQVFEFTDDAEECTYGKTYTCIQTDIQTDTAHVVHVCVGLAQACPNKTTDCLVHVP